MYSKQIEKKITEQEKKEQLINKEKEIVKKHEVLKTYQGEDRVIPVDEYLDEKKKEGKDNIFSVKSGLVGLDKIIGGYDQGTLNILSGHTGQGKTAFVKYLMKNMAVKQNMQVLNFPFEVPPENFLAELNIEDPKQQEFFCFYLPRKNEIANIQWVEDRILESIEKYQVKVVFIDHLDFIFNPERGETEERAVRQTIYGLKNIAVREKIVIFLVAHLNASVKDDERPKIYHIKYSSTIKQAADTICFIHRVPETEYGSVKKIDGEVVYGNDAKIYIEKVRKNGNIKNLKVKFDKKTQDYLEVENKFTQEQISQQNEDTRASLLF